MVDQNTKTDVMQRVLNHILPPAMRTAASGCPRREIVETG
jgi:hypothetical protein